MRKIPSDEAQARLNLRFRLAVLALLAFLALLALTAYLAHQNLPLPAGLAGTGAGGALVALFALLRDLGRP